VIRVVSLCVFRDRDRFLVVEAPDVVRGDRFARSLGGGVEFGETSTQAIRREVREELGLELCDLRLLGVLENLFVYNGKPGHEVVFVYDARFVDPNVYLSHELPINEAGWASPAVWRRLEDFGPGYRLVPVGLAELLADATPVAMT
jgi:8-oxo-dGTP pyrophosphatase MutT (NUDIX family)